MKIEELMIKCIKSGDIAQEDAVAIIAAVSHVHAMQVLYGSSMQSVIFRDRYGLACTRQIEYLTRD